LLQPTLSLTSFVLKDHVNFWYRLIENRDTNMVEQILNKETLDFTNLSSELQNLAGE